MPKSSENRNSNEKTSEEISFDLLCSFFEEKFGHGWKRRLAKVASVPESNVHSWIKAGRMPPWVQRVFELLMQNNRLRRYERSIQKEIADFKSIHRIVEDGDGYAVYHPVDGVGKLVARGIPDLETAREIAALPRLKSIASTIAGMLDDLYYHEVVPAEWFTENQKRVLEELPNWSVPSFLDGELSDGAIEDISQALDFLATELGSEIR